MNIYIINGYGIPESNQEDSNYTTYLTIIFNSIFSDASNQEAVIIPSGGPTSCTPPFDGTEASYIAGRLNNMMHQDFLAQQTSNWRIIEEGRSLSSLENLLFAKEIIDKEQLSGPISVFCESTREKRIQETANIILGEASVRAIDFDNTKNRYADPELIQEKEQRALHENLWTLESTERLKVHHQIMEQKFTFLRDKQAQGMTHVDAVAEWYKEALKIVKEIAPDHPLLAGKK